MHNLHVHPWGFHSFIFLLKIVNVSDTLMSWCTRSHVLIPLYLKVSVPKFTVSTRGTSQHLSFLRLYVSVRCVNRFLTGKGDKLFLILYISIANLRIFLSCIVTDLSFSKSCWNVEFSSYTPGVVLSHAICWFSG